MDKLILWSPIIVLILLSLCVLWWDYNENQVKEAIVQGAIAGMEDTQANELWKDWKFTHCTSTNKNCGRLE